MKFWHAFGHHVDEADTDEELQAFRRVGGQVLDVLEQLQSVAVPTAHAYIHVARCLELFADTLVEPFSTPGGSKTEPGWIAHQALALYHPIPELVIAAKQEAIDPEGTRDVDLPWIAGGRVFGVERENPDILRLYLAAVKSVMDHVEVFLSEVGNPRQARLYWAEATTNFDSARYLFQDSPTMTLHDKAAMDDYLWTAWGYAVGAVQEGAVPGIFNGLDIDTVLESRAHPHQDYARGHDDSQGTPLVFLDSVRSVADRLDRMHRRDAD